MRIITIIIGLLIIGNLSAVEIPSSAQRYIDRAEEKAAEALQEYRETIAEEEAELREKLTRYWQREVERGNREVANELDQIIQNMHLDATTKKESPLAGNFMEVPPIVVDGVAVDPDDIPENYVLVLSARWGVEGMDGLNLDPTNTLRNLAKRNKGRLYLKASFETLGDPAPGHPKTLTVDYFLNGIQQTTTVQEGRVLDLGGSK